MFDYDTYKWHDHLGDVRVSSEQLQRLKHVNELSMMEARGARLVPASRGEQPRAHCMEGDG